MPRVGDAETTGDLVAVDDLTGRVTVHADTEKVSYAATILSAGLRRDE